MKKALLIFFFLYYCCLSSYVEIPKKSIRIRVISSSNSVKDINNKQIIYKLIIKRINTVLKNTSSQEEANKTLLHNQKDIVKYINKHFIINNIKQNYKVNYGYNFFPEKEFQDVLYKSGYYRSLVITIGKGKGSNCWCSIFPRICLISFENKKEYRFLIKDILLMHKNSK